MNLRKWIYDLKPDEFEEYVASILPGLGFSNVRLVGGPGDKGIDILAQKDGQTIAVQVRHRKELRPSEVERFIGYYLTDTELPHTVLFVTSAQITPQISAVLQNVPSNYRFQLLGIDDLESLIVKRGSRDDRYANIAQRRITSSRRQMIISIAGIIFAFVAYLTPAVLQHQKSNEPLDKQIQIVETALQNIRTLQSGLAALKDDMIAKEQASKEINERYAKAKELEKLTDTQIETLKNALQAEKWWKTLFHTGLGFILGVSSSFVGSILYAQWKQRKALDPEK